MDHTTEMAKGYANSREFLGADHCRELATDFRALAYKLRGAANRDLFLYIANNIEKLAQLQDVTKLDEAGSCLSLPGDSTAS